MHARARERERSKESERARESKRERARDTWREREDARRDMIVDSLICEMTHLCDIFFIHMRVFFICESDSKTSEKMPLSQNDTTHCITLQHIATQCNTHTSKTSEKMPFSLSSTILTIDGLPCMGVGSCPNSPPNAWRSKKETKMLKSQL